MSTYFDDKSIQEMDAARKRIYKEREFIYKKYGVDLLDTDALSAITIYEIVKQYDPNYNINFSRNGEDAQSNGVLIEQKATRVQGEFTKTGRPRKNAGTDASFQFHAMGDIESDRYIFAARHREDLSILRIYDISAASNCQLIVKHLTDERNKWLARSQGNQAMMKRDIIILHEKFILEQIQFKSKTILNNCTVYKDCINT